MTYEEENDQETLAGDEDAETQGGEPEAEGGKAGDVEPAQPCCGPRRIGPPNPDLLPPIGSKQSICSFAARPSGTPSNNLILAI
jgi:hypothetical protein